MTPERFQRLRRVLARRQPDLTVFMERVHKPHNFAAVLRTCDAVGTLEAHIVPAEDFHMARKAASGAGRWVRVRMHRDLDMGLARLRAAGLRIVAAHPGDGAVDYRVPDYTRPTALLLGTELDGVSERALAKTDTLVRIPMEGMVRSFNVSVAAAIILIEAARQRREAGMYESCRIPDDVFERTLFEWAHPRIARHCRARDAPYPRMDEAGELLDPVPR